MVAVIRLRDGRTKLVAFGVGTVAAAMLVPTWLLATGQLTDLDARIAEPVGAVAPEDVGHDRESVHVFFQAVSFHPETEKALFNVFPWPSADLASRQFASSTVTDVPFSLFVDEMTGKGIYDYAAGDRIGAIKSEFDVLSGAGDDSRSSDAYYPFDRYTLDAWAQVTAPGTGDVAGPQRAFEFFYANSIPGFRVTYARTAGWDHEAGSAEGLESQILDEREDGKISFLVDFERTTAVRLTVLLLCALMLFNAAALVLTTCGVVLGSRPPSMQALVWSAASVLGTIQLRDMFPGKPRLGVAIDYLGFFPTMVVSMVVALVITVSWVMRSDYRI